MGGFGLDGSHAAWALMACGQESCCAGNHPWDSTAFEWGCLLDGLACVLSYRDYRDYMREGSQACFPQDLQP